ncbi:MAG TPA: porin [Polyangia bacterium]|nr:porin [Polyangia bacterium]
MIPARAAALALATACLSLVPSFARGDEPPKMLAEGEIPVSPPLPSEGEGRGEGSASSLSARTYPLVFLFQGDALLHSRPDAATATSEEAPEGSALRLRRLRIGDDVRAGAWRARAVFEATSDDQSLSVVDGGRIPVGGVVRLTEAFAEWAPHRAFQLVVGAQRVPFSLSRLVDEADLRLPERAQIVAALAPDYRAGASIDCDLGLLDLRAAFFASDTSYDDRLFTAGYLGAFRLSSDPIGPMGLTPWRRRVADPWYDWARFSAGVSVLYGTLFEKDTFALEGDAQVQWRRFTATAEYDGEVAHALRGGALPAAWSHQGVVVEPGIFLVPEHVELVARGAWYHRTSQDGDASLSLVGAADTFAAGAGLTLFTHHDHVRLQAAFETRHTSATKLPDSSWAIFRATFVL